MHNVIRTLLLGSIVIVTSQSIYAESYPVPTWNNEQTPIAWGDCIPVPIVPMGMPPLNMPPQSIPLDPISASQQPLLPMPLPMFPIQGNLNEPAILVPPPSPFFNTAPLAPTAPIVAAQPQISCENQHNQALNKLQTRYNLAAKASKNKIKEITQALEDAQNQMSDGRQMLDSASKANFSQKEKIAQLMNELKELSILKGAYNVQNKESSKIKGKYTELEGKFNSLQAELAKNQSDLSARTRMITVLNQNQAEFTALKSTYKDRNEENTLLKKKIAGLEKNTTDIKTKLKSSATAHTLKNAQDNEIIASLKKKLASLDDKNKTLTTKLSKAETNAGTQQRKLTALGRSTTELSALRSAYKARNNENMALKNKLAEFDNANKTLKTKLATAESNSGAQTRKLTALGQSATELTALKSAYIERNNENVVLKKQLVDLQKEQNGTQTKLKTTLTASTLKGAQDEETISGLKNKLTSLNNDNKTLKTKLATAESNVGSQTRKLTALGQSANELMALKSSYKERNDENAVFKKQLADLQKEQEGMQAKLKSVLTASTLKGVQDGETIAGLKKKLASLDSENKTLKSQLATASNDAGSQTRKLAALGQSATELTALKSAYKERNDQTEALKIKIAELENLNQASKAACNTKVSKLQSQLSASADSYKSLLAKVATLETNSSNQSRKISALTTTSAELVALKSAYKTLTTKKEELNTKLIAAKADTDKDGIFDSSDKCPFTIEGSIVDAQGCLSDIDKDGVADNLDKCPSSPFGTHVNEAGCPKIEDADNDGVADASDLCPSSTANTEVNEFGCSATESITLKGVTFTTGSAQLTTASLPILEAAANTLNQNPKLNIEIAGYTDNLGVAAINKKLSQRRANTVMIYLIKKGVEPNRLTAKGYGDTNPIASNDIATGRATNRRVELKINK